MPRQSTPGPRKSAPTCLRGGDERALWPQHPGQLDCCNKRLCQLVEHVIGHDHLEGGGWKWQKTSVTRNEESGSPGAYQGRAARAEHSRRDVGTNQVPQGIPAYRLAQDVAIEKILAALAATRDGWATARDSLTGGPCQVPTADARDGRRGNQPWSVITTPVSA